MKNNYSTNHLKVLKKENKNLLTIDQEKNHAQKKINKKQFETEPNKNIEKQQMVN